MKQSTEQNSKRLVVLFLFLMIVGIGLSFYFFQSLQSTKKALKQSNETLSATNAELLLAKDSIRVLNDRLVDNSKKLVKLVNVSLREPAPDQKLVKDLSNAVDSTWNLLDKAKFEKALELERKGFEAIAKGNYDEAINFFAETEKVYKSFHQVDEIRVLLEQNKSRLNTPAGQKLIQRKIIADYSMNTPKDLVAKIKMNAGN